MSKEDKKKVNLFELSAIEAIAKENKKTLEKVGKL